MTDIMDCLTADKVAVFGHRGAKASAPMNTIAAFELAYEQGAQGVELDVQLSKDGHLVVIHDDTVDATTDGSGTVSEMTLAELQALDAGAWFDVAYAGARIPTLDEVFDALGQKLLINVEIKSFESDETGIEAKVAECIANHGMQERVIVSSFNPLVVKRFASVAPDVMRGLLLHSSTIEEALDAIDPTLYAARHLADDLVTPERLAAAAEHGHFVNVWTVNDPVRARELADQGVAIIITDEPDTLVDALR